MITFHSLQDLASFGPTVATIGNFDGVHRGHRWIIDQVNARARALSSSGLASKSLAITFDPHPVRLLRPDAPHALITPLPRKLELLATTGVDATLVVPFTGSLSQLLPEQFVQQILLDACCIREIHEGETFRFGYRGTGNMATLATLGHLLGFTAFPHPPLLLRRAPVSSSRIRALLSAGDVSHARALLGTPFTIRSTPAPGRGYGTRYTVPTINLAPYPELLPANGVYITTLTIGTSPQSHAPFIASSAMSGTAPERNQNPSQSTCFQAVTNVGNRPTFGADSFTTESHLLDFHPIALAEDTPLELAFLHRLRPEHRFPNPEALRTQIGLDVTRARRFFSLATAKR